MGNKLGASDKTVESFPLQLIKQTFFQIDEDKDNSDEENEGEEYRKV